MPVSAEMTYWVAGWLAIAGVILFRHWRGGWGVGLLLTYLASFAVLHWLAPALQLTSWADAPPSPETMEGLRQSTFAIAAFLVGVELIGRRRDPAIGLPDRVIVPGKVVTLYLGAALALYLVAPLAAFVPSVSALVSTGATLAAVGVGLKCWQAWALGQTARMWRWLALTALFPLVTVLTQGFLGYGFVAVLIVLAFVASLHRPSLATVAAGVLVFYGGLSIYVTYMRDRSDIREVVWGGEAVERRLGQLQDTFFDVEWFDPRNPQHLKRINERLNQDFLIGAAVLYLRDGWVPYANGGTLTAAAAAVIPRAVWPNKPVVAGSGDIVTTYTGIRFVYGTSVGVGQVMELYVNFGTSGVILGFIVIGMLVTLIDRQAALHLQLGDIRSFALWYMPGLSLLQIGGTLGEVAATAAASAVVVVAIGVLSRGPRSSPLLDAEEELPIVRGESEAAP